MSLKLAGPSLCQTPVRGHASAEECRKLVGSPQAASYPAAPAGSDHAFVSLAERIRDRAAPLLQLGLDPLARAGKLVGEAGVVELEQARVRARVRPDLPALVAQPAQLVPAERNELLRVRPVEPPLNPGPRHRLAEAHELGRDEDRRGQPQLLQHRRSVLEHRAQAVVEGDGQGPTMRRRRHRCGEGRAPIATADQQPQLLLEPLGRDRHLRRPPRADGVVAEDDDIAHAAKLAV